MLSKIRSLFAGKPQATPIPMEPVDAEFQSRIMAALERGPAYKSTLIHHCISDTAEEHKAGLYARFCRTLEHLETMGLVLCQMHVCGDVRWSLVAPSSPGVAELV